MKFLTQGRRMENPADVWVWLILSIFILASVLAYFYVFFASETDLQQMRRILLAGVILSVGGLIFSYVVVKVRKHGTYYIGRNKPVLCLLMFTALTILSVWLTFQNRLPDAFRHAYASAFLAYYINNETAESLGNLVEWVTSYKKGKLFSSGMDQCNNYYGRHVALDIKKNAGTWGDIENKISAMYAQKGLILRKSEREDILSCYRTFFPDQDDIISKMQKML